MQIISLALLAASVVSQTYYTTFSLGLPENAPYTYNGESAQDFRSSLTGVVRCYYIIGADQWATCDPSYSADGF
jgi:hypothetical protein